MAPFDIREVRELMEDDELELDTIGDEKTALFLIMSDTDTTFNFILAMVQSQLINLLCDRADDKYGGRLPVHVRMILDEFANIGQIPNFDKLIATIRSREISASIILQSQSQLKAIYKDAAEIISDNCDCTLFLSGRGKNAKEISDVLGKETIDSYNQSENRGAQTSHGLNYQKLPGDGLSRAGNSAGRGPGPDGAARGSAHRRSCGPAARRPHYSQQPEQRRPHERNHRPAGNRYTGTLRE